MKKIFFEGTVFSGSGEGKKFVALPWVKGQIQEKLGFEPFFGTLNIRLSKQSAEQKKLLQTAKATAIKPAEGYCPGNLINAKIGALPCAIVTPQITSYPKDTLEIIAAVNLREKLNLKDGSAVTVEVVV